MNWILNITSSTPVDRDPKLECENSQIFTLQFLLKNLVTTSYLIF